MTINKVEKGDPSVSVPMWHDAVGMEPEEENLPQRMTGGCSGLRNSRLRVRLEARRKRRWDCRFLNRFQCFEGVASCL
jgi:hypothetical protein